MRYAGAFAMLAALIYLIWRAQTTSRRIERVPFVLDIAAAVALASGGLTLLLDGRVLKAIGSAAVGGLGMSAALAAVYAISVIVLRMPGWQGVELRLPVPAASSRDALRWLRHRVVQHGFEPLEPRAGFDLSAYQGGNKAHWDRRARPKRLNARIEEAPEGFVAAIEVRYVPPAGGLDKHLRPLVEALEHDEPSATYEHTMPKAVPPIEFLVVIVFFMFFALVSTTIW